jgi:Flp pilus assembly protein TadG
MAVEVVLITPLLVMFMLLVVAFGRYVWLRAQIESSARDAVRAAALERDAASGETAADEMAQSQLGDRVCSMATLTARDYEPGATITYTVRCTVFFDELGLIGLPGSDEIEFSSDAPLDRFRRSG